MAEKAKILLIDDDYEYVDNFGKFLERRGYNVFKASNGSFGIEVAEKEKPHIILCDILMIDIDGDEVLKRVKALSPDSIFIVVSSYVDEKVKEKFKKLGAHSFIEKIVLFKPTEEYIREVLKEQGVIK